MAANLMFHQLGQRRADRVLREWFSIGRMTEEEIRRWYRFGKDSIKQIADLTQSSAPKRSQALFLSLSQQGLVAHCFTLLRHTFRHFWRITGAWIMFLTCRAENIAGVIFQTFFLVFMNCLVFINFHFDFV